MNWGLHRLHAAGDAYWTYSLLLYAGLSNRHQRPLFMNRLSDDQPVVACSAGACEDSKVLNRDGSVFALGACSSDDGGEEASALWRSHQHGSLVLVDDLNLVIDRSKAEIKVGVACCCAGCITMKDARKWHCKLTEAVYRLRHHLTLWSLKCQSSVDARRKLCKSYVFLKKNAPEWMEPWWTWAIVNKMCFTCCLSHYYKSKHLPWKRSVNHLLYKSYLSRALKGSSDYMSTNRSVNWQKTTCHQFW